MRLAMEAEIRPDNLALGAAAGVLSLIRRQEELDTDKLSLPTSVDELTSERLRELLLNIWGEKTDKYRDLLIEITWDAMNLLREKF